ncbi:histidine phosphatase family protein [Thalassobaculum sp. OXR-137]|uniref:histidine phosphatase family protein n=1 Tax=Thalassobaculum sp. OXR-137 TaxID=3100173 RepID=UPI002AC91834|nr:histidine phosphatase family protein [Thalassobaculum sp. OXR-137]WPZ35416.1 histidine phosphatase family protein [Thalassobaculum sp. OXR-137]
MTRLALLRHGPTAWNAEKRLQGRADQPLSPDGEAQVRTWTLPPDLSGFRWLTSPLIRARRTAALIGVEATEEPAAIELDFGAWEGRRLSEIRAEDPDGTAANEARGVDFTPPGGESPRAVQARLAPLLAKLAAEDRDTGIVTHKGVIRALLSLATGWPMVDKPPVKLFWDRVHLFDLAADGTPRLTQPNLPLKADR